MRPYIPEKFAQEEAQLAQIWIDSECSVEEVVDRHASKEYRKFYYSQMERKKRLREKGIIEN